jgi:hypothetical protein
MGTSSKKINGNLSQRTVNAPLQNSLTARAKSGGNKKFAYYNAHTPKKNGHNVQVPLTERLTMNNSTQPLSKQLREVNIDNEVN